jgi:hypothetical protein
MNPNPFFSTFQNFKIFFSNNLLSIDIESDPNNHLMNSYLNANPWTTSTPLWTIFQHHKFHQTLFWSNDIIINIDHITHSPLYLPISISISIGSQTHHLHHQLPNLSSLAWNLIIFLWALLAWHKRMPAITPPPLPCISLYPSFSLHPPKRHAWLTEFGSHLPSLHSLTPHTLITYGCMFWPHVSEREIGEKCGRGWFETMHTCDSCQPCWAKGTWLHSATLPLTLPSYSLSHLHP